MELEKNQNDYHGTYNLEQLRPPKLILAGKAVGLQFRPYELSAHAMRLKILATGLPVPKELWYDEPILPGDQPRVVSMSEHKQKQLKATTPVQEIDENAERDAFIREMETTKSFFKVRGMAKAAGAEVGKSDTKADLIEKVRAL